MGDYAYAVCSTQNNTDMHIRKYNIAQKTFEEPLCEFSSDFTQARIIVDEDEQFCYASHNSKTKETHFLKINIQTGVIVQQAKASDIFKDYEGFEIDEARLDFQMKIFKLEDGSEHICHIAQRAASDEHETAATKLLLLSADDLKQSYNCEIERLTISGLNYGIMELQQDTQQFYYYGSVGKTSKIWQGKISQDKAKPISIEINELMEVPLIYKIVMSPDNKYMLIQTRQGPMKVYEAS